MSVNADKLVQIIPRIIEGGTPGLTFAGLLLSQSELLPAGRVVQFASAQAVANYFGSLSEEASMASMYFSGYVNTTSLPDKIFFARYNGEAVGAWLRGAKYTGNIAVLQAVTNGAMVISIDNTPHTLSSVDLSAATSFSQVAEAIQTALTTAGATGAKVTYSSQTGAFQIDSPTTGASSAVAFPTPPEAGTDLGALLLLTEQSGAVQSVGMAGQTLPDCMTNVLLYARDWVTFSTVWEPELNDKIALAQWCAGYDTRFAYVLYDTDNAAQVAGSTASAGYQIAKVLELDGTVPGLYDSPVQIEGFSTDAMVSVATNTPVVAEKGVDGHTSFGWVPTNKEVTITLAADSPSRQIMEDWATYQETAREVMLCNAEFAMPSINRKITGKRGGLTSVQSSPNAAQTLQASAFVITFDQWTASPL